MNTENPYLLKPWLAHYEEGVPENVQYEDICLPECLIRSAEAFPDKMALNFQGYRLSFAKLNEMVDRFATVLTDFGIKRGDSVAILLPNVIPCVVAYFAIMRIGAITVMNNPLYSDRELEHQFNDSGAKALITLDLLGNRMIDLRSKTQIEQIVITSIGDYLPFPKNFLFPLVGKKKGLAADVKPADNVYRWKSILNQTTPKLPQVSLSFEDVAMYQYTGGTTGKGKGVMHSHATHAAGLSVAIAEGFFQPGNTLVVMPLFHIGGISITNAGLMMGNTLYIVPALQGVKR